MEVAVFWSQAAASAAYRYAVLPATANLSAVAAASQADAVVVAATGDHAFNLSITAPGVYKVRAPPEAL